MGAVHTFDLTTSVTHLVVADPDTEKYRYVARQRDDMKVMLPEFVDAVRMQWMGGNDANIHQLEAEFRYPTFKGVRACVTGRVGAVTFRQELETRLTQNGATFQRDLTRDVTHLIAKAPTGKKYEYAGLWGVKVVTLKWVEDSLARGMFLDERRYHPSLPEEKQGEGAWVRSLSLPPLQPPSEVAQGAGVTDKHSDSAAAAAAAKRPTSVVLPQRARKIRRVASMKLGSQTDDLWGAIMAPDEREDEEAEDVNAWTEVEGGGEAPMVTTAAETAASGPADAHVSKGGGAAADAMRVTGKKEPAPQDSHGFWHGCRFFIYGFTTRETGILTKHMTFHDAKIVNSIRELGSASSSSPAVDGGTTSHPLSHRFIIVPFSCPRARLPSTDGLAGPRPSFVNDLWVEKCLHQNRFIPPDEHAACTPFPTFPVPGFHNLIVSSTGFSGIDLLHLVKVVKLMGATYDEYLTSKSSVLVCGGKPSREKLLHSMRWHVPAVSAAWVWESLKLASRQPFDTYLLQPWEPRRRRHTEEESMSPHRRGSDQTQDSSSRRQSRGATTTPATSTTAMTTTTTMAVRTGPVVKSSSPPKPETRAGPFAMSDDDDDHDGGLAGSGGGADGGRDRADQQQKCAVAPASQRPGSGDGAAATRPVASSADNHGRQDFDTVEGQPSMPAEPVHANSAAPDPHQPPHAALAAITTLLRKTSSEASDSGGSRRRRRRLFGRAASNASLTSHNTDGARSREQSVDASDAAAKEASSGAGISRQLVRSRSLTDQLPTLDSEGLHRFVPDSDDEGAAGVGLSGDDGDGDSFLARASDQPHTQVRYEDPEAAALKAQILPGAVGTRAALDMARQRKREMLAARLREGEIKQERELAQRGLRLRRVTRSAVRDGPP
ncbi:hypothetical protein KEM52_004816 [Ascosphaera acerosa]|nr:hypothetical protein KEM52_004816 [Ascosphaera acerosa]